MTSSAAADKSKPYIPLAGLANDGWSKEDEATATCFCGAVQLAFVSRASKSAYAPIHLMYSTLIPHFKAYRGARSSHQLHLQLHRLP